MRKTAQHRRNRLVICESVRTDPIHGGGQWCSRQLAEGVVSLTYNRRAEFPSAMTLDASVLKERVSSSIPTREPAMLLRLKQSSPDSKPDTVDSTVQKIQFPFQERPKSRSFPNNDRTVCGQDFDRSSEVEKQPPHRRPIADRN